jgi:hypothetical protein
MEGISFACRRRRRSPSSGRLSRLPYLSTPPYAYCGREILARAWLMTFLGAPLPAS